MAPVRLGGHIGWQVRGYQSSDRKPHLCVLLGGASGTEYLVSTVGLNQPAAGKGVVLPGVRHTTPQ